MTPAEPPATATISIVCACIRCSATPTGKTTHLDVVASKREAAEWHARHLLEVEADALARQRDELRAALERIQWGSCDGCGNDRVCPACKGWRPTDGLELQPGDGHRHGWPVAAALGLSTVAPPPEIPF